MLQGCDHPLLENRPVKNEKNNMPGGEADRPGGKFVPPHRSGSGIRFLRSRDAV